MTSELRGQQQEFANAIRFDAACTLFKLTPQGQPARLHIYGDAYRIRLGLALKENYPVLASVLGDDGFADLAREFLRARPSTTPSIRWFGAALTDYAAQEVHALPHPALIDLIRMEWALNTAFDAADSEPLTVAEMLTLSPETWPSLRFEVHPSLRLLQLSWNVEPLWTVLSADKNAETAPPEAYEHHLLIWRIAHRTQWRSVEPVEALLLGATISGCSFAELCESAAQYHGTGAAETVAGYLRIWVEAGLLAGIRDEL